MKSKKPRPKRQTGEMGRRAFLSGLGGTLAAAALPLGAGAAAAMELDGTRKTAKCAEPRADRLTIREACPGYSGIPLGGIGAGSIEIKPDGTFRDWLIFNMGAWDPWLPPGQKQAPNPGITDHSLAFFLWTKEQGGEPICRRLNVDGRQQDLYSLGWAHCVEAVEFAGEFPRAELEYVDKTLPVNVRASFFSPFIAHDSRVSGTPGFHGVFTISNPGKRAVDCSLVGTLHNPLASGAPDNAARKLSNTIRQRGKTCWLVMETTAQIPERETVGSMALSLTGGRPSYIAEDFGRYLGNGGFFYGSLGTPFQSFLGAFRESGRLPSLPAAGCPAQLLQMDDRQIARLTTRQAVELVAQLAKTASLQSVVMMAERVNPEYVRGKLAKDLLRDLRDALDYYAGKDRAALDFGAGALCTSVRLEPGETMEIPVAFSWYFPYHISARGPELGHQYEHWFADAPEANEFLVENASEHRRKVASFVGALGASNVPAAMRFSWSAQLSTLVKCTWWLRDGEFAVFEGLGCCGFETMDVTYQGSAPILALFPDLEMKQMELTARNQNSSGQVPHNFEPDFDSIDQHGWGRVDLNPQFIMVACRDYLWTGDKKYLAGMWPHVKRALAYMDSLDEDGDGLPERDTGYNTYDQWALQGTPAYIGSLWLGAYSAAERMAADVGDRETGRAIAERMEKAQASFDKKLWNGSYYNLWFNRGEFDPCCMTDQISGIWFSSLAGLKPALPDGRVREVLAKIYAQNFNREQGLVNASYPAGTVPRFPAYGNLQGTATWTGIEYAAASFFLDYGMTDEAIAIVEAIDRRYSRAGRWWNHEECGDHYYRAMASWCSLVAATGFKPDQAAGQLQIAPRFTNLNAPWFSAQAFGTLQYAPQTLTVNCLAGEMAFRSLVTPIRSAKARLNGHALAGRVSAENGLWRIEFGGNVRLSEGSKLVVVGA
jgi:uncharacterized protein (DUF608 family)